MKKYTVRTIYKLKTDIVVYAKSEEDALWKAKQKVDYELSSSKLWWAGFDTELLDSKVLN